MSTDERLSVREAIFGRVLPTGLNFKSALPPVSSLSSSFSSNFIHLLSSPTTSSLQNVS